MYKSIQVCRAVAAIMVVLFHLGANLAKDKYFGVLADPLERFFSSSGEAGVAFFFVLSGFIIFFVHGQDIGRSNVLGEYFKKRLIRIYPTYFLIFFVVYVGALCSPSLRESMPTEFSTVLKSLLLVPQDKNVVGGTGAPVIVVAWSLQYEMVFYLYFAIGIVSHKVFFLLSLLLLANVVLIDYWGFVYFPLVFLSNPLVLLFGFGMVAAYICQNLEKRANFLPIGVLASLCFLLVVAIKARYPSSMSSSEYVLACGLLGAILVVALVRYESGSGVFFDSRLLNILGDSSYALYLVHFPLISVVCKVAVALGLGGWLGIWITFTAGLFLCLAFGVFIFFFFERPVIKFLRSLRFSSMSQLPS